MPPTSAFSRIQNLTHRSARLEGSQFVLFAVLEGAAPERRVVGRTPAQVALAVDPVDGVGLDEALHLLALHLHATRFIVGLLAGAAETNKIY